MKAHGFAALFLIRGIPFAVPSTALKLEQFSDTEQVGLIQYAVADYTFSPAVTTPLDQWIDLVHVNKAGAGMSLYLDGTLVGTNPTNINLERYQIGSDMDTIPESSLAIMNEAIIYNRALSPTEIAAQWAAVPEPSTISLAILAMLGGLARIVHVRRRGRACSDLLEKVHP